MNFALSWASAADQVAELVGLTCEIAKKEITGQPRDPELETQFSESLAKVIQNVQKGLNK